MRNRDRVREREVETHSMGSPEVLIPALQCLSTDNNPPEPQILRTQGRSKVKRRERRREEHRRERERREEERRTHEKKKRGEKEERRTQKR